jgi:putative IMPACT (imprinted ancient) family translation regulator
MKFLLETTESYRVSTEEEVTNLIEEAKRDNHYILKKHTSQVKERKQKGEVIDTWYKVTLTKYFTDEKEPEGTTEVAYTDGSAF